MIDVNALPVEGYWKNEDLSETKDYPIPIPHDYEFEFKQEFVDMLKRVQESASPRTRTVKYMGWSDCRICGCMNGTKEYYTDKWRWPEGYLHYIEKHNVFPSEEFFWYIINRCPITTWTPEESKEVSRAMAKALEDFDPTKEEFKLTEA